MRVCRQNLIHTHIYLLLEDPIDHWAFPRLIPDIDEGEHLAGADGNDAAVDDAALVDTAEDVVDTAVDDADLAALRALAESSDDEILAASDPYS